MLPFVSWLSASDTTTTISLLKMAALHVKAVLLLVFGLIAFDACAVGNIKAAELMTADGDGASLSTQWQSVRMHGRAHFQPRCKQSE